jgi:iron complex transport system substrate-binding protein
MRLGAPRVSRGAFLLPGADTMALPIGMGSQSRARARIFWRGRAAICAEIVMLFLVLCGEVIAAQSSVLQEAARVHREATDELGRQVQVPEQAKRIVSLAPSLTEIVFELGDGDHLVGDTDFCDYPAEAAKKPHVGGPVNPNLEQIVSLMPDVILATSMNRRETVDALDRLGLPVFFTDPHSVDGMIASVEHIGDALGTEKSAEALAGDLRRRLSDLDHRLAGIAPRRVLFIVWTDPLISAGRNTFIADAMRRAGGRPVIDTNIDWPHISLEELARLQPEVLVFASEHSGEAPPDIRALRALPGWKDLDAVRRGNIIVVSDAINRPSPRIVDAIEQLARALHPEAFASRAAPPLRNDSIIEEACACAR